MAIKIYTRSGDEGETGLFGGERVFKDDLRVAAYGTIDELNALLGVVRAEMPPEKLDRLLDSLQHELFTLGADLATPGREDLRKGRSQVARMTAQQTAALESLIDEFEAETEPLTQFILPGGHKQSALLHFARTVCRRAEREYVALYKSCPEEVNPEAGRYLNRLSDLLFVLARWANHFHNVPEPVWISGKRE